ncbi:MAG TPA: hypothetical protein VMV94_21095 [Phycisphaerae bacterium]|nr:hypothetical protein [Phycisphaerae bacterium]
MVDDAAIPTARPTLAVDVKRDPQGRLAEDVACRRCGYNLRSLSLGTRCPECGTAVGRSLQGDLLRFAEPQWVQTLGSGTSWIVISIAVGLPASFVARMLVGKWGFSDLWAAATYYFGVATVFVGYWMLTTSDPACFADTLGLTARRLVRITQVTAVLFGMASPWVSRAPFALCLIVALVGESTNMVSTVTALIHARQLALRIPDDKMAAYCTIRRMGGSSCSQR